MRGPLASLAGVVALTATLLAPVSVSAQPTTVAGLLAHYYDLSKAAEVVNEELLLVQEQLKAQQTASAAAVAEAEEAQEVANAARSRVYAAQNLDQVAAALSSRRDLNALAAFTSSNSPEELLGKLEAASLAAHLTGGPPKGDAALAEAEAAEALALEAKTAAEAAEATAATSAADVQRRQGELQGQIAQVSEALENLTPEQRELLTGIEDYSGDVSIPAGDIGAMLEFALAQRGKPYIWGATGPDTYDCSGLVQTAFRAAGVNMPRVSRQQATVGIRVDRANVRPGDLVFYGNPVHHVVIAIDSTYAVHAPSFGDVVKISKIDRIEPIAVIRRIIP